jgi:hypothetical protein
MYKAQFHYKFRIAAVTALLPGVFHKSQYGHAL